MNQVFRSFLVESCRILVVGLREFVGGGQTYKKEFVLSSRVEIFLWGTDGRGITLSCCRVVSLLARLATHGYFIYSHARDRTFIDGKKS